MARLSTQRLSPLNDAERLIKAQAEVELLEWLLSPQFKRAVREAMAGNQ